MKRHGAPSSKIVIITTCVARKAGGVGAADLALVPASLSAEHRVRSWQELLQEATGRQVPLPTLYQGDHWSTSLRALAQAKTRFAVAELWVISAGLGLLPVLPQVEAPPYAASFTPGHPESVTRGVPAPLRTAYVQAWWNALARTSVFSTTLTELAAKQPPGTTLLLIASTHYITALASDLQSALSHWPQDGRRVVLSGQLTSDQAAWLAEIHFQTSQSMSPIVGGAAISLNARVAAWLLERLKPDEWCRDAAHDAMMNAIAEHGPVAKQAPRKALTPRQIAAYIQEEMRVDPTSASALHRRLRAAGMACEQKRFVDYYRLVVDGQPFPEGRRQREAEKGFQALPETPDIR